MASSQTTAPKPPVRIAVIGFGGLIGRRHTAHVLANTSATLAAVVDSAPGAPELAAQLAPGVPYYRSVAEMLSAATPDAAIVCTPNAFHVSVGLELADAGVHLLVEKPLADTTAAARTLVDRGREKGVKLLVGHHRRFNPYIVAARKVLEASESEPDGEGLGTVSAISGLWAAYKPEPYFASAPWRRSRRQGGGPIMINFVHEVDNLQYLLGPISRVSAERIIGRSSGSGERDPDAVEDGAAFTLRFASGAVGTFILADGVVSPHFFEAGTGENPMLPRVRRPCPGEGDAGKAERKEQEDGEPADVYRIFGTNGTLSVPDMTFWSCGDGPRSWESKLQVQRVELEDDPRVPFDRQLDHFIAVIREETQIETGAGCTGEEGLRVIAVCEALVKALDDEEGGRVTVRYDG
ncbi:hypothetical protein F5Y03DRAFT_347430 [Xylaria venustula]|nr:hypothetical protein F5Y03DRAFT_347430 [Xylaria venustula]